MRKYRRSSTGVEIMAARTMHLQWEPSLTTRELRDQIRGDVQKHWGNVPYTFIQQHDDDTIVITELEVRLQPSSLTDNMVAAFREKLIAEYTGTIAQLLEETPNESR